MGRNIPSREIVTSSIHPIISLAICVTWIAALVTTISSLCGIWSKKSSKASTGGTKTTIITTTTTTDIPQNSSSSSKGKNTNSADNNATTTTNTNAANDNDDDVTNRPLPPPPSATKLEFGESAVIKKIDKSSSLHNYKPAKTRRKLTSSISLKMSMKIKDKASDFKEKASEFKDKATEFGHRKAKNDNESLWTKRIILGEKCKLPNEEEIIISDDDEEEEGKNKSTLKFNRAMSRSLSSINTDSIPSLREEEKLVRIDYKGKGKEKVQSDDEEDCS